MISDNFPLTYGCHFGDLRLNKRFNCIINTLVFNFNLRLSICFGNEHQTKAVYRFMDNSKVDFSHITDSEQQRLLAAIATAPPRVLVHLQDTTTLNYSDAKGRFDLPCLNYIDHRGYFLHSGLVLNEQGCVLGLLKQDLYGRSEQDLGTGRRKGGLSRSAPVECLESDRWLRQIDEFQAVLNVFPQTLGVSISDCEGDFFELLTRPRATNGHLITRVQHNRLVENCALQTDKLLAQVAQVAQQPVQSSYFIQALVKGSKHKQRPCELQVRFCQVYLSLPESEKWCAMTPQIAKERQKDYQNTYKTQPFWVVQVTEINAPKDTEPIEWTLITTCSVTDYWQAIEIVRLYALRWHIEIFHLVLKQGCAVEALQLEKAQRIQNAIGIYSLVAVQITKMRYAVKFTPDQPMTSLGFQNEDFNALAQYLNAVHRHKIPLSEPNKVPSVEAFLRLIHILGGGKNTQPIGTRCLWLGWDKAFTVIETAKMIRNQYRE
jgi:hypothetical protein